MRVHHLNCATMLPLGGRLIDGRGHPFRAASLVAHCLLAETGDGLVLVDTGLGTDSVRDPGSWLTGGFRLGSRPVLDPEETALRQVERLGYAAADVRHVVVTHLDLDHAGGLRDFPHATVHVSAAELAAAAAPATRTERLRYHPPQWAHGPVWRTYPDTGDTGWFGLDGVRGLVGVADDVLLVPLAGHTRGHSGVAVRGEDGWLLHAGDAFFHREEVERPRRVCPAGLRLTQWSLQAHRGRRVANQDRLRELVREHSAEVRVFCAHDPVMLARFV
jgi:glyoxylase-like metal-dependent hydrolase (beta-lactamase superfamily II)